MKQNINKFSIIAFCIFLLTCFTALAESPEEKGLRLAIEGDKKGRGISRYNFPDENETQECTGRGKH